MKVKIKRIDTSLPLPKYQTSGSVALDLSSRIEMEIPPREIGLIPANIIVETPPGFMFAVVPRSSTPQKKGLLIPHGLGVIDQDYCGEGDEILIQVYNFTDRPVKISRGERIAQGIFVRVAKAELEEVKIMKKNNRGGIGSTG